MTPQLDVVYIAKQTVNKNIIYKASSQLEFRSSGDPTRCEERNYSREDFGRWLD